MGTITFSHFKATVLSGVALLPFIAFDITAHALPFHQIQKVFNPI